MRLIFKTRCNEIFAKMQPKNKKLKLFTKSWPPKSKSQKNKNAEEHERPLTATLDKPQILDIRLIGKIDMSLITKEFFTLTNIVRVPLAAIAVVKTKAQQDRLSKSGKSDILTSLQKRKKLKSIEAYDTKKSTPNTTPVMKKCVKATMDANNNSNNNNTTKKVKIPAVQNNKSIKLAQPCSTCGKIDHPERFHSHPQRAEGVSPRKQQIPPKTVPVKNSVLKPVAIKFKSKKSDSLELSKGVAKAGQGVVSPSSSSPTRQGSGKGPKMKVCYLCGREFGTASLPLHEPKCLEVSYI